MGILEWLAGDKQCPFHQNMSFSPSDNSQIAVGEKSIVPTREEIEKWRRRQTEKETDR